jgi:hypothetical protein
MARLLNAGVLPAGYYAVPFLDRDGPFEIDVAALREAEAAAALSGERAAWAPDEPPLSVAVEWPPLDDVGVEVYRDDGDPRLAAAIELVSPRNKDRPAAREVFVPKCADHLRHGRGLVVVDAVTTRRANLHADLLARSGAETNGSRAFDAALSAVSYEAIAPQAGQGELRFWPFELQVGSPLPTAPLWLVGDLAVPLDLEASHSAACADLRIPL